MRISMRWLLPAGAIVAAAALVLAWMPVSGTGAQARDAEQQHPTGLPLGLPAGPAGHFTCFSIVNPGMTPRVVDPEHAPAGIRGHRPAERLQT